MNTHKKNIEKEKNMNVYWKYIQKDQNDENIFFLVKTVDMQT